MSRHDSGVNPADPPPARLTRVSDSAACKFVVALLLLATGGWVCATYQQLLIGPEAVAKPKSIEQSTIAALTTELSAGAWQLGNLNWEVSISTSSHREFREIWTTQPSLAAVSVMSETSTDAMLLMLIRSLKPVFRRQSGLGVYQVDRGLTRLQFWTRQLAKQERLVFVRVAVNENQQWQLLQIQPTSQALETSKSTVDDTWPNALAGTSRICRRYGSDRRILAEVWSFDIPLPELVLNWEKSGWQSARFGSNRLPTPVIRDDSSPATVILKKGPQQVIVQLILARPGQPSLAILTRIAETSPK